MPVLRRSAEAYAHQSNAQLLVWTVALFVISIVPAVVLIIGDHVGLEVCLLVGYVLVNAAMVGSALARGRRYHVELRQEHLAEWWSSRRRGG